jgi:hypothetical protein
VTTGGDVVDSWYTGYGDMPPWGHGPDQGKLQNRGNSYIRSDYPLIDFIIDCSVIEKDKKPLLTKIRPQVQEEKEQTLELELEKEISNPLPGQATKEDSSHSFLRQEEFASSEKVLQSPFSPPAIHAIILLVVAIAVLICLYQYNSSPVSPKSQ